MTTTIKTQTLGYPRIGRDREIKRALSTYWKGNIDREELLRISRQVAEAGWQAQKNAGIDCIGVGDATLYDHVLDWAVRFDLIPDRFRHLSGLDRYFAMARGAEDAPALEMTKWFDTNYHYLVPEITAGMEPAAAFAPYLEKIRHAQTLLGERAVPIVLGPVTLLRLSRLEEPLATVLARLLPVYVELLEALKALDVPEVQLHEPALVLDDAPALQTATEVAVGALAETGVPLNLVTYFDDLGETYEWVLELPVDILTLDFTRGETLTQVKGAPWPADKVLAAGVIDGRNVWRMRGAEMLALVQQLADLAELRISASSSLQFVPYSAARETGLPTPLRGVLAFAEEKLEELTALAAAFSNEAALDDGAWTRFKAFAPDDPTLHERIAALQPEEFRRAAPYAERRPQQIRLPSFPTTTIGSFPQTREVRRLRGRYKRGEITAAEYRAGVDAWIGYAIGVQEGLGLDVLVHGEFERSDMVEYFAQKLTGFAFTQHGWVQSYGHRYVRPPIIYADVTRPEPMTVREFQVAQSFTQKPVKGMLTGPVTIVNWSFPRAALPKREIAFQLALALREEIADLEAAGARIIQVDEPALREGLPFKRDRWDAYLTWAVDAFRLATGAAKPTTQIHTHMCYAEFGDILEAIERMDADVISIENARSGDETLHQLAEEGYAREVGPGVYDVHSPVVPDVDFILGKLRMFRQHLDPAHIWVNPDCGLKTRAWKEVIPSLRNLVIAAKTVREAQT
ncbi:MAG: 5-methyltetrahydropteroyltriglutamate--homocysteine S-methyltransferase [Anaerolineae bacterium]